MKSLYLLGILAFAGASAFAVPHHSTSAAGTVSGDYLEVRTCDVYTGSCFANSEMGLTGKEAILLWSVREGKWNNTALDGLKVIAVVKTDQTMGDQRYQPRSGKAVLVVDAKANSEQREALQRRLDEVRSQGWQEFRVNSEGDPAVDGRAASGGGPHGLLA